MLNLRLGSHTWVKAFARSSLRPWALIFATLLVLSGFGNAVFAEQTRPRPGARGAKEEEKEPETLQELQSYQSFTYVSGGRDPLTIRLKTEAGTGVVEGDDDDDDRDVRTDPEQMKQLLRESIARVETLMLSHDYKAAIAVLGDVRNEITAAWGGAVLVDRDPEVNSLYRRVLAYERTAKRLQQLEEIQDEFRSLNIEITGIRWTPKGSSALINGVIYESGGEIKEKGLGARVQIESIEESAVVFIYKGQRFRKVVGTAMTDESN